MAIVLIVSTNLVNAQDATTTSSVSTITPTSTSTAGSESRKEALKNRLTSKKAEAKTSAETRKMLAEEKKAEIEALRAAKKAEIEAAREAFKEQLQTITDEKKKAIAEKISENLTTINKKATDRMFGVLDKLNEIMVKVDEKIAAAKTGGKDTSSQEADSIKAKTAITTAVDAVTEQAAKDYVVTLGTPPVLKADVGKVVSQQKQDLKTTYETVRAARQLVRQVARSLKDLNNPSPSTPSGAILTPTSTPGVTAAPTGGQI